MRTTRAGDAVSVSEVAGRLAAMPAVHAPVAQRAVEVLPAWTRSSRELVADAARIVGVDAHDIDPEAAAQAVRQLVVTISADLLSARPSAVRALEELGDRDDLDDRSLWGFFDTQGVLGALARDRVVEMLYDHGQAVDVLVTMMRSGAYQRA